MIGPLLKTKLYTPHLRPDLVPRQHLVERLNAGLDAGRKLTLVSAPAGYGKTTLINAWLRSVHRPSVWVSLDAGDNSLSRFLTYLLAASRQIDETIGQTLEHKLKAPQLPVVELLLTDWINDVAGQSVSLILVLDDYHAIVEPAIHKAVAFLLERQPPQLHLVIVSRQDPPLSLALLRGRGQLTELRQRDLRFTPEEALVFLNRSVGLDLEPAQVVALDAHTEGWIAGLQMAAFALQTQVAQSGTAGIARFVDHFSGRHHFILDYLTDQVLERQPGPIYRFLLYTSILERMCGSLCDALIESQGGEQMPAAGQQILEQLQQSNLFVVPLDDERKWYRYHRLFAELLRARLQETEPDRLPELHRRAAAWYDQNALSIEAVDHALGIPDHDLAAAMIERAVLQATTWSSVDVTTFQAWVADLPEEVIDARPRLQLIASRVFYLTGRPQDSERLLDQVETLLEANPAVPDAARLLGLALADRASYAAVRGDVGQAIGFAQRALARLPENEVTTGMRVSSILGLAYYRAGDMSAAAQAFSQAIDAARTVGLDFAAVPLVCNLAQVYTVQGQLDRAAQLCQQVMEMGTVDGVRTSSSGFAELELARILFQRNDLPAAEAVVLQGLALLEHGGTTDGFGQGHALLAQIKQAQGDGEQAGAAIQRALQIAQAFDIARVSTLIAAHQARLWLAQGEIVSAARWAQNYARSGQVEYLREFEDLTLARVFLAQREPDRTLALLDALLLPAETAGRMGTVIEILALRALALAALGDTERALQALGRGLQLAEPQGHVRVFLDGGQAMATLLRHAAAAGFSPGYVSRLLGTLDGDRQGPRRVDMSALIEPLSGRELEVLELIAAGLSNAEIAQRLVISLPTVKSHTRNLYGKLGVHGRKRAVERASALGLLSA